jgi:hypothetical protein
MTEPATANPQFTSDDERRRIKMLAACQAASAIVIPESTITQVALDLASKMACDETYTEEQFLEASAVWLRAIIKRITDRPGDFAWGGLHLLPEFNVPAQCGVRRCTQPPLPDDTLCREHREEEDSYMDACRDSAAIVDASNDALEVVS